MSDLESRLAEAARCVEHCLEALLADRAVPERLALAMRHAVLGGGKRLRPFLVVETAGLLGLTGEGILHVAAAVECVHCYSLVHDDLPSMDDDDMRRGRPTVHRAFDEATAVLAGDALQALAFEAIADPRTGLSADTRIALAGALARAAGAAGMVGGQMLDLDAEGRFADGQPRGLSDRDILALQALKTGALIRASVEIGAIAGGASQNELAALNRYGEIIGQAFQIADDILDHEADAAVVGKAVGKDAGRGKATLVGLWGVDRARARLQALVAEAGAVLAPFGARADILRATAHFVAGRDR